MIRSKLERTDRAPRRNRHAARVRREIEQNLAYYAAHPAEIDARLEELAREPNLESLMAGSASVVTLAGFVLGAARARFWYALPLAVHGLLAWHALRGTSPAAGWLRSLGVRTHREIAGERFALKVLRGDVDSLPEPSANGRMNSARKLADAVWR